MPRFQSARSSGSSDRGQPACSTTTVSSPQSASVAAAASSRSGCTMSSKIRSRSASARRTSARGTPTAPPIGRMPRNRGELHLLVEQALGVGDRVLGHDPADDRVGMAGRLGQLLQLCGLRAGVGPGRGGDVHELHHVPVRRLGEVRRLVEAAGTSPRCHPCRAPAGRRGTGTSRVRGSQRWMCASTMRSIGAASSDPSRRDGAPTRPFRAGCRRPSRGPPARRTRSCLPGAGGCADRTSRRRPRARRPRARRRRRRPRGAPTIGADRRARPPTLPR